MLTAVIISLQTQGRSMAESLEEETECDEGRRTSETPERRGNHGRYFQADGTEVFRESDFKYAFSIFIQ